MVSHLGHVEEQLQHTKSGRSFRLVSAYKKHILMYLLKVLDTGRKRGGRKERECVCVCERERDTHTHTHTHTEERDKDREKREKTNSNTIISANNHQIQLVTETIHIFRFNLEPTTS